MFFLCDVEISNVRKFDKQSTVLVPENEENLSSYWNLISPESRDKRKTLADWIAGDESNNKTNITICMRKGKECALLDYFCANKDLLLHIETCTVYLSLDKFWSTSVINSLTSLFCKQGCKLSICKESIETPPSHDQHVVPIDLLVLTTAILQPDLYRATLPVAVSEIEKSTLNTHWVVNVDLAPQKMGENLAETVLCIWKEIAYKTNIVLTINISEKPCFFNAVSTVCLYAKKLLQKETVVFYLEIDWRIEGDLNLKKEVRRVAEENTLYRFTPTKTNWCNFQPALWPSSVFRETMIYTFCDTPFPEQAIDPEVLMIQKYVKDPEMNKQFKYRDSARCQFFDVGREWIKNNKIVKWKWGQQKKDVKHITYC